MSRTPAELCRLLRVGHSSVEHDAADLIERWDNARPPCPTCKGTGWQRNHGPHAHGRIPDCPDCDDGKVSIEKLVEHWNEEHLSANTFRMTRLAAEMDNLE